MVIIQWCNVTCSGNHIWKRYKFSRWVTSRICHCWLLSIQEPFMDSRKANFGSYTDIRSKLQETLLHTQVYTTEFSVCKNWTYIPRTNSWPWICNFMHSYSLWEKKTELNCPGLMYIFISRATTIGAPENCQLSNILL